MSSPFDPDAFLNATTTDAMSTQVVPVPVGEYQAVIDSVEIKTWQKRDDPSKSGLKANIMWLVDDENVKALLGRDKVTVRQDMMLDITDSGTLDVGKGRNVQLGRLREAVNLNRPGEPFSFQMLQGRAAKVTVAHRTDNEAIYAEVKAVTKL